MTADSTMLTQTASRATISPLERVAAGEVDAVKDCIDAYGRLVWSTALRYSATSGDAEDAVQEIFIKLWEGASKYDPQRISDSAFVAMVARRHLIDRYRKSVRRPRLESIEGALAIDRNDQEIERSLEASIAMESLQALLPESRDALILSVYYGMSHSEIASATGWPLGTVKTRILRGMDTLRKRFRSFLTEGDRRGAHSG